LQASQPENTRDREGVRPGLPPDGARR